MEELETIQKEVIIKEKMAVMKENKERKEGERKRTKVYRTLNHKTRKFDWFSEKKTEE